MFTSPTMPRLLLAMVLASCGLVDFLFAADVPITRGQSQAEVRARLGPPRRMGRQILFGRHIEQWSFDEPRPFQVEFNCVRGQDPYVCAILQLSPARP
jgi:hypothetical protein